MFDKNKIAEIKIRPIKKKIIVIDGTNNLIRSASIAERINLSTYGMFLKSIAGLIDKFKPSQCYIVFDGQNGNTAKRKIFAEYKANRSKVSKIQTEDYLNLFEILKYTPIITIRMNNIQGDDVIGHIVKINQALDNDIIVCSADRDFYQLCSKNTQVFDSTKKYLITQDMVIDMYKCHPVNFPIFKAIIGDNSDNIPGVKGIGEKTLHKNLPENILMTKEPINGDVCQFRKYIENMQHSDFKLKMLQDFGDIKRYWKIVNLRRGASLNPQAGSIIQDVIDKKIQNLEFDKKNFVSECRKHMVKPEDLVIIYPSLHMITGR